MSKGIRRANNVLLHHGHCGQIDSSMKMVIKWNSKTGIVCVPIYENIWDVIGTFSINTATIYVKCQPARARIVKIRGFGYEFESIPIHTPCEENRINIPTQPKIRVYLFKLHVT